MMLHLTALVLVVTASLCESTPSSPHIIFIVADDLGWNDIGYNNPDIISPTLDSLANSGIILNQSYVQPVCSPYLLNRVLPIDEGLDFVADQIRSRTAFMTGVYPFRLGMQHLAITDRQDVCVPLNQTFFPQVLKSKGYTTHMIGKWHLGFCNWACTPTFRGFDSFYGFYSGAEDYYTKAVQNGFDFRFNTTVETAANGNYSTLQFANRVDEILEDHNPDSPMYLYLAFQSVHMPLQVPDNYLAMYPNIKEKRRKALSAMVTSMDEAVGRLVTALKDKGMYNDTIIAFSSDNGGWSSYGGNNYPLRGGKISLFEGGTRVPAFIHSPKLANPGTTYDGMVHAVDWFPTLAKAAGVDHKDSNQDGIDLWDSITNLKHSKRHEFVYNLDYHPTPAAGQAAIRVGDYKLIEGYPGFYDGWYKPEADDQGFFVTNTMLNNLNQIQLPNVNTTATAFLFNLKDDPFERNNLYDTMPDMVTKLKAKLEEQRKRYVEPNFPLDHPLSEPSNYGGLWAPGWC